MLLRRYKYIIYILCVNKSTSTCQITIYTYIHLYHSYYLYIFNIYNIIPITIHTYVYIYFTYPLQARRCVFSHRRTYSSRTNPTPTSQISHHIQLHSRKGLVSWIYKIKTSDLYVTCNYHKRIIRNNYLYNANNSSFTR